MRMNNNDIGDYALMLLVKSGVISKEDMKQAMEDLEDGVPNLLKKTSKELDKKNGEKD